MHRPKAGHHVATVKKANTDKALGCLPALIVLPGSILHQYAVKLTQTVKTAPLVNTIIRPGKQASRLIVYGATQDFMLTNLELLCANPALEV